MLFKIVSIKYFVDHGPEVIEFTNVLIECLVVLLIRQTKHICSSFSKVVELNDHFFVKEPLITRHNEERADMLVRGKLAN